jgi:hypothetical protein
MGLLCAVRGTTGGSTDGNIRCLSSPSDHMQGEGPALIPSHPCPPLSSRSPTQSAHRVVLCVDLAAVHNAPPMSAPLKCCEAFILLHTPCRPKALAQQKGSYQLLTPPPLSTPTVFDVGFSLLTRFKLPILLHPRSEALAQQIGSHHLNINIHTLCSLLQPLNDACLNPPKPLVMLHAGPRLWRSRLARTTWTSTSTA